MGRRQAELPFPDASFDLVTISFGIRNATRLDRALAEIRRVTRPGGRFFCLEFSRPRPWLAPFYGLWSRTAIPVLGAMVSGRREACRYLVRSIDRFPDQPTLAAHVAAAGFTDVAWRDLSFGIAAIHSAPPALTDRMRARSGCRQPLERRSQRRIRPRPAPMIRATSRPSPSTTSVVGSPTIPAAWAARRSTS